MTMPTPTPEVNSMAEAAEGAADLTEEEMEEVAEDIAITIITKMLKQRFGYNL